jgi:flavorubredoxin
MNKAYEIKKDFYWVGAIDWGLRDFHGYLTEKGSTYNAFLLMDEEITLFDTVKAPFTEELIDRISSIIDPSKIDNIVINHVEMDHSGALPHLIDRIKPKSIICPEKGKQALIDHFGREDWPYKVLKKENFLVLGKRSVRFIETPMLHWPDSMFSYIQEERILLSSDAFGQHYATSERFDDEVEYGELMLQTAKYYANILLPYSHLVGKLVEKLNNLNLDIEMIAPDHGLMWRKNIGEVISVSTQSGVRD